MASPLLAPELEYRDYKKEDDESCKALEMRAMQGSRYPWLQKFTRVFIRAGFEHFLTFDAKPQQYEDHIIRVAEDRSNGGRIVGVGCAALKTARIHSKMSKVAYIFDLRVDEEYQGCGIGKALTEQIEEGCAAKGASFLYLTVNSDNTKAKSLYAKRGFVHASHRSPALALLAFPDLEDSVNSVEVVGKEAAIKLTSSFYSSADLFLEKLDQLFDSPLYEGTFVARKGDSIAGVSAWNGSSLTGFKIERIFLPISWWRSPIFHLVLLGAGIWAAWRWAVAVQATGRSALETRSVFTSIWFLAMMGITFAGAALLFRAWPVISFIGSKVVSDNTKMRHRLFGPFAFGPTSDQEELMRAVMSRAHNAAREAGYAMSICNMDARHPLRPFFPSNKFSTIFMYKPVEGKESDSGSLPPLTADNFFDPRDL